jgi:hypothetical protein
VAKLPIVPDLTAADESVVGLVGKHTTGVFEAVQIVPDRRAARVAGIETGIKSRSISRRLERPCLSRQSHVRSVRSINRNQRHDCSVCEQQFFHDAFPSTGNANDGARFEDIQSTRRCTRVASRAHLKIFFYDALRSRHENPSFVYEIHSSMKLIHFTCGIA